MVVHARAVLRLPAGVGLEIGPTGLSLRYSQSGRQIGWIPWTDVAVIERPMRRQRYGPDKPGPTGRLYFVDTEHYTRLGNLKAAARVGPGSRYGLDLGAALLAIGPTRLWALIEAQAPAGLVKLVPRPTKG
jgi:hypothetical protein